MKKIKVIFPDGSIGEIDESQLNNAISAGAKRYTADNNKSTTVVFPDGSMGDVSNDKLGDAIEAGAIKKKVGVNGTPVDANTTSTEVLQQPVPITSPSQKDKNFGSDILNPKINPFAQTSISLTVNGAELPIVNPTPLGNSEEAIGGLRDRIAKRITTPADVQNLSAATGKSVNAVQAYVDNNKGLGTAIEASDRQQKNIQNLASGIEKVNKMLGLNFDPNDILSSADKSSQFYNNLQQIKEDAIKSKERERLHEEFVGGKMVVPAPTSEQQNADAVLLNQENEYEQNLKNHVVNKTVEEDLQNGVPKDQTINKIFERIDPKGWVQNARSSIPATPLPGGNIMQDLGNAYDYLAGNNQEKSDLLNSQKGIAEQYYNNGLEQVGIEKKSQGIINNDQQLIQDGDNILKNVDYNITDKYPSLIKAEMVRRVNDAIARESGVAEGFDTETGHRLERAVGANITDYARHLKDMGYLDNPKTKDLALSLLAHPSYFADNSILGDAASSFLQPFKELGMSIGDITGFRNNKDILSDKIQNELFPKDIESTPNADLKLKGDVRVARTIVNTTANLAGMLAIATVTEGLGEGAGLTKAVSKGLGAYTSFGLPSFDTSLKDSKNFIDSEPAQYLYATINAVANAEGGRLLDLGKITRIPGVSDDFATLAKGISNKTIDKAIAAELLEKKVVPKYIDFALKYGRNVTKGAATMTAFNIKDNILKATFGDPNAAANILPQAGHAFIDGVLGMSILGGFGTAADMRNEKNTTYKGTIYNMALNPDATKDILTIGLKNGEYAKPDYDNKVQILNTAIVAKNSIDAAEQELNTNLSQDQKAVYVANKTAEAILRNRTKQEGLSEETKNKYLSQADKLAEQNVQVMDGLKFTSTLEPLYDLYEAEKNFNIAQENLNPEDAKSEQEFINVKDVYDKLYSDYLKDNSSPSIKIEANGKKTETSQTEGKQNEVLTKEGAVTEPTAPLNEDENILHSIFGQGKEAIVPEIAIPEKLTETENKDWNSLSMAEKLELAKKNLPEVSTLSNVEIVKVADANAKRLLAKLHSEEVPKPETINTEDKLLNDAKDLVNSDVVKGYTADVIKDAANNNPEEFKNFLSNIADQAHDEKSASATIDTYGEPLVNIAKELFPKETTKIRENKNVNLQSNEPDITTKEQTIPATIKQGGGEGGKSTSAVSIPDRIQQATENLKDAWNDYRKQGIISDPIKQQEQFFKVLKALVDLGVEYGKKTLSEFRSAVFNALGIDASKVKELKPDFEDQIGRGYKLSQLVNSYKEKNFTPEQVKENIDKYGEKYGITPEEKDFISSSVESKPATEIPPPEPEPPHEEPVLSEGNANKEGIRISKEGIFEKYGQQFSKTKIGWNDVSKNALEHLRQDAIEKNKSIESEAASQVFKMTDEIEKNRLSVSEDRITTATFHLINMEERIDNLQQEKTGTPEERSALATALELAIAERDLTLKVIDALGSKSGRNLGLFAGVFSKNDDGGITIARRRIEGALGIEIPETEKALDENTKMSNYEKNKVRPYVKKLESIKKEYEEKIRELEKQKPSEESIKKERKKASDSIRNLANKVRSSDTLEKLGLGKSRAGGAETAGFTLNVKELLADALDFIADGIDKGEELVKLISEAAKKFAGKNDEDEFKNLIDLSVGNLPPIDKNIVGGIVPFDVKADAIDEAKEIVRRKTVGQLIQLSRQAENANRKWYSKALDWRRSFLIGGIKTAGRVLISGVSKFIIDPIAKQTTGRIVSLLPGLKGEKVSVQSAIEGVESLIKFKDNKSALEYVNKKQELLDVAAKKLEKSNSTLDGLEKKYGKDSNEYKEYELTEHRKIQQDYLNAELENSKAAIYKWINGNGFKDAKDLMKYGSTDFEEAMGGYSKIDYNILSKSDKALYYFETMNRIHGVLKNPSARRALVETYNSKLENYQKEGIPLTAGTRMRALDMAYGEFLSGKYQEKTQLTDEVNRLKSLGEQKNANTFQKIASGFLRLALPVAKIGVNIVKAGIDMSTVGIEGVVKYMYEVNKGIKLNEEQHKEYKNIFDRFIEGAKNIPEKDRMYINKVLSRGLFGLGLMLTAGWGVSNGYIQYGGEYDEAHKAKRKYKGRDGEWHELDYGEWILFGHHLGKFGSSVLNHLPEFLPVAMVVNTHNVYEYEHEYKGKEGRRILKDVPDSYWEALKSDVNEITERLPYKNLLEPVQLVKSLISIPITKDISEYFDKDKNGNLIERKSSNIFQQLEMNVGLRKFVDKKKKVTHYEP